MANENDDHDVCAEARDRPCESAGEPIGEVQLHGLEHALAEQAEQGAGQEGSQEEGAPGKAVSGSRLELGEQDLKTLGQGCAGRPCDQDGEGDPDQAHRLPPEPAVQAEQEQDRDQAEPDQVQRCRPYTGSFHAPKSRANRVPCSKVGARFLERTRRVSLRQLPTKATTRTTPDATMTSAEEITSSLERCYSLVAGDPGLRADFRASRSEFFPHPEGEQVPGAELRHLEWFLLERPSPVLGSVPLVAWTRGEGDELHAMSAGLRAALLSSIPGAFEVTSIDDGGGSWVRDLFTQGEHPLASTPVSSDLQAGDLLVGRLFPASEDVFVASPAAVVYRSSVLLSAVRADLDAMRKARRGVLRIQQLELERLFLGRGLELRRPPSSSDFRERARAGLVALGVAEERVTRILAHVRRAVSRGTSSEVTELLNQLAFETHVDLERARQILVETWEEERRFKERPTKNDDVRAALEVFDRGRGEGKDLDSLFSELERSLGLESEPTEEEQGEDSDTPEFPGIVRALVEEFLWDQEREKGVEHARRLEGLRVLGEYARDIGVLEELGRVRLLDFSARWLLDEPRLSARELEEVLDALAEFCVWAEEIHDIPLKREFEATLQELRPSVVRLAGVRRDEVVRPGELGRVVRADSDFVEVQFGDNQVCRPRSDESASQVRAGDLVRLDPSRALILAAYPPELAELVPKGGRGLDV
jgi:hypothetical protein